MTTKPCPTVEEFIARLKAVETADLYAFNLFRMAYYSYSYTATVYEARDKLLELLEEIEKSK